MKRIRSLVAALVALLWSWPAFAAALAKTLLALAVTNAPPGRSVYSAEIMPECGTDAKHATCPIERVCETQSVVCAPPRWSEARGAWVRVESREAAVRRYQKMMDALAKTAHRLTSCLDDAGLPIENCEGLGGWPRGRGQDATLGVAGLVTAVAESFLREDIENGMPPNGIGPGGELASIQIMPAHAPGFAGWLTKEERDHLLAGSQADLVTWGRANLLGEANLEHAFEVGLRALARARSACNRAGVAWTFGMWSMYGTGARCAAGKWAMDRATWYDTWYAQRGKTTLPEWAEEALAAGQPSLVAAAADPVAPTE